MHTYRTQEHRDRVIREASRWVERMEHPSALDQAEFAAWLAQDPTHVGEYLELVELDRSLHGIDAERRLDVEATLRRVAVAPPAAFASRATHSKARPYRLRGSERRSGVGVTAAVASFATLAIGVLFTLHAAPGTTHETARGESRVFVLADGSRLHLNSSTRVHAHFDDKSRDLELTQGEALVDVIHDSARPFRVLARGTIAQALGTQFDVRIDGDKLTVTVKRGRVAVVAGGPGAGGIGRVEIEPFEQALVSLGRGRGSIDVQRLSESEAHRAFAWTGSIDLSGMSLREAVDRFNRANTVQIVIDDPTLDDMPLSGQMALLDPESFVSALRAAHLAAVEMPPGYPSTYHLSRVPSRQQGRTRVPSR